MYMLEEDCRELQNRLGEAKKCAEEMLNVCENVDEQYIGSFVRGYCRGYCSAVEWMRRTTVGRCDG